jgi:signal transduction histidine kinase
MLAAWPIRARTLLVAGAAYAVFAASISYWFTRTTGLSRWTMAPAGPALYFPNLLGVNLAMWCGWALMAVAVFALGRRFPIGRDRWLSSLAVHLPVSMAVTTAHIALVVLVRVTLQTWWGLQPAYWPSLQEAFFRTIDGGLPVYWALLGLQHAADYHRQARAREVAAAQLETQLVEARLSGLQRQLHPHFLFNTLHAISALVREAPDRADEMIEKLSDMLRVTLAASGVHEVPLAQELEFLEAYLAIEQVHFGPRLAVTIEVPGELAGAAVPSLLLQPLAENAIRHGLAPLARGGRLLVRAARAGDTLVITVADTGRGPGQADVGLGVGLRNTRARLAALYGPDASLRLDPRPGGGTTVEVRLPFRDEGVAPLAAAARRAS